jgi:hypothetical protein
VSSVDKEHCAGCLTLKRVRKDEKIGEHTHPVTGARCGGVDELSVERAPLTALRLAEQFREIAKIVARVPGWQQETTLVSYLVQLLGPRIERMEQERAGLKAEVAMLADAVVMANAMIDDEIPEGSQYDYASETLHLTVENLKEKYPRLRG